MDMDDSKSLATKYWHKIGELEKQLGEALRRIKKLETDVERLTQKNVELNIENAYLKEQLFGEGKKKDKDRDEDDEGRGGENGQEKKKPRSAGSYRRPMPKEDELNGTQEYRVDACSSCGSGLTDMKWLERFVEDIPTFWELVQKIVVRERIRSGYCQGCKKRSYGKATNLQGQKVTLGPNIKLFVLFLVYVVKLSFKDTIRLVYDLYRLELSEGEITNIIHHSAERLRPEHRRIRKRIRGRPGVHMDETGWRNLAQRWYAWIMTPSDGEEVSFELDQSRGRKVAERMLGKNFSGTLIKDFYKAYYKICKYQQDCWVHLIRDFRDLAENKYIPEDLKAHVKEQYADIAGLYAELRQQWQEPFHLADRKRFHRSFDRKLLRFAQLCDEDRKLKKLKNLKLRIQNRHKTLLTCLIREGVLPQNNTAEQRLRHLVLKRKISFGSVSAKGAESLAINLSVLLTTWRKHRNEFFPKMTQLLLA